jgi:Protein of unknown function (DUF3303)
MLFMVIERFKGGTRLVEERFKRDGRMLPEDVDYIASWVVEDGSRCFQLMEAPDRAALNPWIARWEDLVAFEVSAVLTSAEFWAGVKTREG